MTARPAALFVYRTNNRIPLKKKDIFSRINYVSEFEIVSQLQNRTASM